MKLNPNATATIVIGGLALCHRNKKKDIWEVVFLRNADNFHNLKLKISDQSEVAINKEDEIVIKVLSPKSKTDTHHPKPNFSRKKVNDVISDARWILDFSSNELHNRPLKVKKNPADNFLTIPNALFYSWNLSGRTYSIQKKQGGTAVGDPVEFEELGEFMAGDIECHPKGSVSIEVKSKNGDVQTYSLKRGDIVFFDNRCPSGTPQCAEDFQNYYDIIVSNGEKFELTSLPTPMNELQAQGLMGDEKSCESGQIGDTGDPGDSIGGG